MKKLFLFLLILPLAFVACSDDDDIDYSGHEIIGSWELSSSVVKALVENDIEGGKLAKAIEREYATDPDESDILTFSADGKLKVDYEQYTIPGKFSINGNKLTIELAIPEIEELVDPAELSKTVTFSIDGNVLTVLADLTDEAKEDYLDGEYDYVLSEGESFGEASIKSVIETIEYTKK